MAATLVIVGLTFFVMGSVLLGRDAAERGRNSLLFMLPFVGFAYTREHWSDIWWMAMMRIVGGTLILTGTAIVVGEEPILLREPDQLFLDHDRTLLVGSMAPEVNTFVNVEEQIRSAIRNDDNPNLTGRIHGQPFAYDRVQIVNGVISIQQGEGMLVDREVRILMDIDTDNLTTRESWYVQPADQDAPEIQLSWRDNGSMLPEAQIITGGYRLELQLARIDTEQFKGYLQVLLPDGHNSYLSGEFIANANFLRYVGDQVDLRFDHADTLEYVAQEYLDTQFQEGVVRAVAFEGTQMRPGSGSGAVTAIVTLNSGQVEQRNLVLERSEIGWSVTPGSMVTTVLQGPQNQSLRLVAAQDARAEPVEQDEIPPVNLPREQLSRLLNQEMTLTMADGKTELGVLREIKRARIRLEKLLDGGVVQAWLPVEQIVSLVLKSGQMVILVDESLPDGSPAPTVVTDETAVSASEPEVAAEETAADVPTDASVVENTPGQTNLAAFLNREVSITDTQGRQRQGLVTALTDNKLTLRVQVGSGTLNYYYAPDEISSITEAGQR